MEKRGGHEHYTRHTHSMMKRQSTSDLSTDCTSLYGHPESDETVTAYDTYNITWDCSCIDSPSLIDITLYTYGGGALHQWQNVPCADNTLATEFKPTWWNSTQQADLQLQISQSDQPSWASSSGPGPAFEVTWNGTTPASAISSSGNSTSNGISVESVSDPDKAGGLTGGKLGAAVTVPLLAAAAGVAVYIFYSRRKGKKQRKRWSAYVDHRLSQYSAADQSGGMGTGDARPSMSMSTHARSLSTVDPNAIRPASTFSLGANNFAGVGSAHPLDAPPLVAGGHSRNQSHSGTSALGRPPSSFYALDGHSTVESPSGDSFSHHRATSSVAHPNQMRQIGHGDRVSKVSFAGSALTSGPGNRQSSYFANGPGTASSPNRNRYKHALATSVSSMHRANPSSLSQTDPTDGVDSSAPRPLSQADVTAIAPSNGAADNRPSSLAYGAADDSVTAPIPHMPSAGKKHNITISTSMPSFSPATGRQSILSPDDLLRAYASSKNAPAMPRSDSADTYMTGIEGTEELAGQAHDEAANKAGKFGGKFGFGFAK